MSSSRELLRELLCRENPVEGLRVFAGHAGWAPGQLESEVARGDSHLRQTSREETHHGTEGHQDGNVVGHD